MPKPLSVKDIVDDDRGRQSKALARWESQKAEWDRLQRGLARRVGKDDPLRTLQGSTHEFRMRTEELGMIDTSVPAEVKNGVSAWEMNLRASGGGVRYVQVGSSYPYPLYCPIRDAESVKPDNHTLMRVIPPEALPERHKPVSSGEYFQSRQHEFAKHIKRKFSHYTASEFFGVEGTAPPIAEAPVPEDPSVAPYAFYPMDPRRATTTAGGHVSESTKRSAVTPAAGAEGSHNAPLVGIASRPLSAVVKPATPMQHSVTGGPAGGPMIVLSTAHLHFSATPNEAVQATLRVDNTGTTAVFYSWAAAETDTALPTLSPLSATSNNVFSASSGSLLSGGGAGAAAGASSSTPPNAALPTSVASATNADGLFRLSDVANAVLLPDETKHFTISFRSPEPGIFSHVLELLTVPAGRERILIHLRAVVVGGTGDSALTTALEAELAARAPASDAASLVNHLIMQERDNPFDTADMRQRVAAREAEIAAEQKAESDRTAARKAAWERLNAPLGLPWHPGVYSRLEQVYQRIREYAAAQVSSTAAPAPPPAAAAALEASRLGTSQNNNTKAAASASKSASRAATPALGHDDGASGSAAASSSLRPARSMIMANAAAAAAAAAADPVVEPWNGGLRDLLETVSIIRDPEARNVALSAIAALLDAAAAAQPPEGGSANGGDEDVESSAAEKKTFSELLWTAAGRQRWGNAAAGIQSAAGVARDIAEGRAVVKTGSVSGASKANEKGAKGGGAAAGAPKGGGKGAAAAAAAGGAASSSGGDGATEKLGPDAANVLHTLARRCVSDAVAGIFEAREYYIDSIQRATTLPIVAALAHRAEDALNTVDVDKIEPLADAAAAAKGKKK